jgi:phage host-nuclease inhibitor protein Gam
MLGPDLLSKALVGAEANQSVKTVMYREPTASEKAVAEEIAHEVGRIEAKMSVMLAHIEGHYESQVANLKIELARLTKAPGFFSRLFGRTPPHIDHHPV